MFLVHRNVFNLNSYCIMSDSTTRISDLPSNIKFELNDESQGNHICQ